MSDHSPPPSDAQIDRMIADYLTGSLSESDRPAFEAWLRASPEHPKRVARLSLTEYGMREVCQDTKAGYLLEALNQIDQSLGPVEPVTLHDFKVKRHNDRLLAIACAVAAMIIFSITLALLFNDGPKPAPLAPGVLSNDESNPGPVEFSHSQSVATLTTEYKAAWGPQPGGTHRPNALRPSTQLLAGQRLNLTQGFAELTTHRGAKVLLQAPCSVELTDSDNAIRLHSGRLVGTCETLQSKGFTVHAPGIDVVDLGTEFGVSVNPHGPNIVQVTNGLVAIERPGSPADRGPSDHVQHLVSAGQAVRITGSEMVQADYDAHAFVNNVKLQAIRQAGIDGYQRWRSYSETLRERGDLAIYYSFEKNTDRPDRLANVADSTRGHYEGKMDSLLGLAGPAWTQGRWPGKEALRFDRSKQQLVRVPIHDETVLDGPHSFVVWVRFDDLTQSQHLLAQKNPRIETGEAVNGWTLSLGWNGEDKGFGTKRSFYYALGEDDGLEFDKRFKAASNLEPGQWVCFAVTSDRVTTTYFLNGKPFASYADAHTAGITTADFTIGTAEHFPVESLGGVIDEFAIFTTRLSEKEILDFYMAGKP
ncbi:MAG: LamG-like jellyroll fold domain-containing protein [Planctomycetota bacterium]